MSQEIQLVDYQLVVLDYRNIQSLQGERKVLEPESEKRLLKSLKQKGKFVPEYVWLNPDDGQHYALDGHQRLKTYNKHGITFNGGYDIPFLIIQADSAKDAAEKLQIIDSDYGKVTRQGLQQFADAFNLDVQWMNETTVLSEFESFNFIDSFRAMQANMNRDMIPNIAPPANASPNITTPSVTPINTDQILQYEEPKAPEPLPRSSDDNYASISEVMKYTYKIEYNDTINKIQEREGIERREEAFIFMVRKFNEHY